MLVSMWLSGVAEAYIDGFDPNADGAVRAVVVLTDGNLLVGGEFTQVAGAARGRIAKLRVDGTADTSFTATADGTVLALAEQADGKILIGGRFTTVNGEPHNYIARLNADGSIDPAFLGPGASYDVTALAVQGDGKILVGGQFSTINGSARPRIARLNSNGNVDSTFNTGSGPDSSVYAVAIQRDGKILVGGDFTSVNAAARNRIARLNADGSLDTAFSPGTGFDAGVNSLAVQPDGQVLAAGAFTSFNATSCGRIVRLKSSGALDSSFTLGAGAGADNTVNSVVIQPDGQILIAGAFTAVNGFTRGRIARLNVDGSNDTSFDPGTGANAAISALAIQADGKSIVAVGEFTSMNSALHNRNHIARMNACGVLDSDFLASSFLSQESIDSIAIEPDGKIIVGGNFTSLQGITLNHIARLNASGTIDTTFNPGTGVDGNSVLALALQPDGKVVLAGIFTAYNGIARKNIARINANGSLDSSFSPGTGPDGPIYAVYMNLNSDGKLYFAGSFARFNGKVVTDLVRLDTNGEMDPNYIASTAGILISSVVLQPDGKLLGAGDTLFRLNFDGTRDVNFNVGTGPNNSIYSIATQPGGKIIAGGVFISFNGTQCYGMVRLNEDGSVDPSFKLSDGSYGFPQSVLIQANGQIVAGGNLTPTSSHCSILNNDGSLNAQYVFTSGGTSIFAMQEDGKIVLDRTIRITTPIPAKQKLSFTPGGYSVTWELGGSYPWPCQALFEDSSDGIHWNALGMGAPVPGIGYRLSNLRLPVKVNHYIRATGWVSGAKDNGSMSMFRSVLRYYDDSLPYSATANWAMFH